MSKKLYIYSAILAIVYVIFFCHCLYDSVYAGVRGGLFGLREHVSSLSYQILGGNMIPVEGGFTFPSSIINDKTGESMRMEIRQSVLFLQQFPDTVPFYIKALKVASNLLIFIVFVLFIYLPFIAYKMMKSISKDEFYAIKNINRIRKISYVTLTMFLLLSISQFFMYIVAGFYIQPEGYKYVMEDFNYSLLFLGLVVLILSEILRYTTTIKEEVDLTV